jgi:hypothetical protein
MTVLITWLQVAFYKKRGYDFRRFHVLVRTFLLKPDFGPDDEDDDDDVYDDEVGAVGAGSDAVRVMDARDVPFEKLHAYDTATHGTDRKLYLRDWLLRRDDDNNHALAAYDVINQRVVGFAVLTHAGGQWDVSPLYADNDAVAKRLLKAGARAVGQRVRVRVRIPFSSTNAIKLFNGYGELQQKRVLYLMSDNALPQAMTADKVYSLSTVCFGLK